MRVCDSVYLLNGDMLRALRKLPDSSVDSVVTDPPYDLNFMGNHWDRAGIAFSPATWAEVLRVLKPGGHLVAFGASRGYHRMACAIEDAGFDIRDSLMWIYGSGFPKSLDVSKAIDKAAGAKRMVIGTRRAGITPKGNLCNHGVSEADKIRPVTSPATADAEEWDGWGTALKPAFEPIVLARKPLSEKTVAANVLRWRTGALNIGACRIAAGDAQAGRVRHGGGSTWDGSGFTDVTPPMPAGRWPANVVLDGSGEVVAMFPNSKDGVAVQRNRDGEVHNQILGAYRKPPAADVGYGGGGSAARFFYHAKASKADRAGSDHPTVKPVSLMQWLCRLITPPGGIVLDPFAGSGTTGEAAAREGFNCVLVEREPRFATAIANRFGCAAQVPIQLSPLSVA